MAESLDRKDKNNNVINDDMIRDALKTELSSIKASDYLINKTLLRCQEEIEKGSKKKEERSIMPWILKLGTPLAAGALVLVLLFNTNLFRATKGETAAAPHASAGASNLAGVQNTSSNETPADVPAPSLGYSRDEAGEALVKAEGEDKLQITFGSPNTGKSADRQKDSSLRSSTNNETNDSAVFGSELWQLFDDIVDVYNQANETQLKLDTLSVTRISCLVKEAADPQVLMGAQNFDEIVSDEGYWALPLLNADSNIEKILTVCNYDLKDADTEITSDDILYTIERKQYIVSELPAGAENLYLTFELLHMGSSSEVLEGHTDIRESTVMVVDINDGMDFLYLSGSSGSRTAIPYLTHEGLFSLENGKEYTWDEFVETVSQSLEQ